MEYFIYQRVSTEKQTVERQESAIGEYCRENGIEVPTENVYSDIITGKTIKRYWLEGCTRKRKKPYNGAQKF